jgi:hypothetical protein
MAGYAAIVGGDDRVIGNVFLGGEGGAYGPDFRFGQGASYGTAGYDGHPASLDEYLALVDDPSRGDHERFMDAKQPVYIRDNVYAGGARAYEAEQGALVVGDVRVAVVDEGDAVYLEAELPEALVTVTELERVRFVDADFEEPDGTPLRLDSDLAGERKAGGQAHPAGPLATRASRTRVW